MKTRTVKSFLLLLLIMALFPLNALAAGITSSSYDSANDVYRVNMDLSGVQEFKVLQDSSGKSWSYTAGAQDYMTLTCNGDFSFSFYDSNGGHIGGGSVTAAGIQNENPDCKEESPPPPPAEETPQTCDSCAVMECPAWADYMGKLDGIKAAIPPPPNWDQVADTFRDSIAPRIKEDMASLIGSTSAPSTPSLPSAPTGSAPSAPAAPSTGIAPDKPSALNDGGIQAPTGQEAPGLGDSTFSPDDVKSAPEIQFNEDPTGGFILDNPIGGLPSQEEFKQNAPIEGEVALPVMPGYDPSIPAPSSPVYDPSNPAPSSGEYDPSNPAPVNGEYDPSNPAPSSGGGSNEDFSPKAGNYETTPIPGGTAPTAPTPTEPAPVSGTAPIPGNDGSAAPIPGNDGSTAPTPGG